MRYLILILLSTLAINTFSESYSKPTIVKGITLGNGYSRIRLASMIDSEGCANQGWYVLDTSTKYGEQALSTLLTAKVSQSKVSVQLHMCIEAGGKSYPKINHLYFCDTQYCT